jgi:hypothetical protein
LVSKARFTLLTGYFYRKGNCGRKEITQFALNNFSELFEAEEMEYDDFKTQVPKLHQPFLTLRIKPPFFSIPFNHPIIPIDSLNILTEFRMNHIPNPHSNATT